MCICISIRECMGQVDLRVGPKLTSLGPTLAYSSHKVAQVGSKLAQVGPKLAPSWPQVGPSWLQVGPKLNIWGSTLTGKNEGKIDIFKNLCLNKLKACCREKRSNEKTLKDIDFGNLDFTFIFTIENEPPIIQSWTPNGSR